MKIYEKITDLIGRTPIMKLNNYSAAQGLDTPVLASLNILIRQEVLRTE